MSYKLCLKLIYKNWLANLILIFQICISVILANVLIGNINLIRTTTLLLRPLAEYNGGFFMPLSHDTDTNFLDNMPCIDKVFSVDQYLLYYNNIEIPIFAYDAEVVDLFRPKIVQGTWLGNLTGSHLGIPVVMAPNTLSFNVGDLIACKSIDQSEVPLNIVGEMTRPAYILNFNTTSNNLQPNHLLRYYDYAYNGYPVFLACKTDIEAYIASSVATQITRAVIFSKPITAQQLQTLKSEINKYGGFTSFSDVMLRGENQQRDIIRRFLPFLVCGFSVSFIGLIAISILHTVNNTRIFSILYILGYPWKRILLFCMEATLTVSILSLLFVVLSYCLSNIITGGQLHGMVLGTNNIFITLLIYIVFLLSSILSFAASLSKDAPIQTLRNIEI